MTTAYHTSHGLDDALTTREDYYLALVDELLADPRMWRYRQAIMVGEEVPSWVARAYLALREAPVRTAGVDEVIERLS